MHPFVYYASVHSFFHQTKVESHPIQIYFARLIFSWRAEEIRSSPA